MTHQQKVDHLIADLGKKGVSPYTVAPPVFRMLWALGIRVPPPFFLSFHTLTLMFALVFGILWGGLMWLIAWQGGRVSLEVAIIGTAIAGVLFGLSMAGYFRWKARRFRLPEWENYPGDDPGTDPHDE